MECVGGPFHLISMAIASFSLPNPWSFKSPNLTWNFFIFAIDKVRKKKGREMWYEGRRRKGGVI